MSDLQLIWEDRQKEMCHEYESWQRHLTCFKEIYFCIRVCSESFRKRKNKQFWVQEFSADVEFDKMTRQGGKLGVL